MSLNRRTLVRSVSAAALLVSMGAAWAAQPIVEIIAFTHPPVQSALKPLRDWLASQGKKARVVEIDMETPEAEKRLAAIGLKGHIPIVVLVDGKYKHIRQDGSAVEFVSFPNGPGTPAGVKGGWSAEDVQALLQTRKF
jgi:hypothetical protein